MSPKAPDEVTQLKNDVLPCPCTKVLVILGDTPYIVWSKQCDGQAHLRVFLKFLDDR